MVPAQPGALGLASPWAPKALGWHQCQKLPWHGVPWMSSAHCQGHCHLPLSFRCAVLTRQSRAEHWGWCSGRNSQSSPLSRGIWSSQCSRKGNKYLLRALGAALGAFLLISSALPVSAVHGVAFPCVLCMGEMSWMV